MIKKTFKKFAGLPADSFADLSRMTTRKLPIPGLEGTDRFVQFTAKRGKDGFWTLEKKINFNNVTTGVQAVADAYEKSQNRHQPDGRTQKMHFDAAFLILREMEDALLSHTGIAPEKEPAHHFMHAYRLAPKPFQAGMDAVYHGRLETDGAVLPARKPASKGETPKNRPLN